MPWILHLSLKWNPARRPFTLFLATRLCSLIRIQCSSVIAGAINIPSTTRRGTRVFLLHRPSSNFDKAWGHALASSDHPMDPSSRLSMSTHPPLPPSLFHQPLTPLKLIHSAISQQNMLLDHWLPRLTTSLRPQLVATTNSVPSVLFGPSLMLLQLGHGWFRLPSRTRGQWK